MLKLLKRSLCMLLAVLLAAALPCFAFSESAEVNSSSARFYRSDSTSSQSVSLEKGVKVSVKSVSGKWARVSCKGVTGYVQVKYLDTKTRRKAYVSKETYVYRSASSGSAKKSIGVNTRVYVVGVSGDYCRVENASGSAAGYILASCLSKEKVSTSSGSGRSASWKDKVVKLDWFNGGSDVLKTGHYGYIYDIDTGITVRIKRMGGHNHADVEPATASDTAKLKKIAGGSFSWDSHAVILHAGGKYVACAINTMPHGDQTISSNNYDGQFCLHMTGSLTHESEEINDSHQSAINRAYNWAH